jgi:hypothetical protein
MMIPHMMFIHLIPTAVLCVENLEWTMNCAQYNGWDTPTVLRFILAFCRSFMSILDADAGVLQRLIISDGAYFHLSVYVNRKISDNER